MPLQVELQSDDPVQNLEWKLNEGLKESRKLELQLDQLPTRERLEQAKKLQDTENEKIEQALEAARAEKLEKFLARTEYLRHTLPHGELLEKLVIEADRSETARCVKHPGRQITFWGNHVRSFQLHPEFKENSPTMRRIEQEKLEREQKDKDRQAEKEYNMQQIARADRMAKEEFVPV